MTDTTDHNQFHFNEAGLRASIADTPLAGWTDALIKAVKNRQIQHGDLPRWQSALDALPALPITKVDLDHEMGVAVLTDAEVAADELKAASVTALDGGEVDVVELNSEELSQEAKTLEAALQGLKPWRKGPYRIAHVAIDTEWHSDWKWNRVAPHISDLKGRTVLDVGCGSGYHMWRMRAQGAKTVIGIDPGLLFSMQFQAVQKYINDSNVCLLPLTMETMPENMHVFDTVFSMGVLYHRKDPHAHLKELLQSMRPGAELIMETLVVLGEDEDTLALDGRYARMRNIWTLPTVPMLSRWMLESGFTNIRFVSLDITSRLEQRTTEWMPYESLIDSLDPSNLSLTVEGHPRPRRAIMIADAPVEK